MAAATLRSVSRARRVVGAGRGRGRSCVCVHACSTPRAHTAALIRLYRGAHKCGPANRVCQLLLPQHLDMLGDNLKWYDRWFKGVGEDEPYPRERYFVMSENTSAERGSWKSNAVDDRW